MPAVPHPVPVRPLGRLAAYHPPCFRLKGAVNSAVMAQGGVGDEREASGFALEVDGAPDGFDLVVNRTVRLEPDRPKFCCKFLWRLTERQFEKLLLQFGKTAMIQADENPVILPANRITEDADRGSSHIPQGGFFFLKEGMVSLSGEEEKGIPITDVLNAGDSLFFTAASLEFGNPDLVLSQ